MIKKDDIFIVVTTADGERVAVPAGTKQGQVDDKFIPVRTADGFKVPCAVDGKPSIGDTFLPVSSADGERVAVPLEGGSFEETKLPFSKGEVMDTDNFSWDSASGVLSLYNIPPSPKLGIAVFYFAYWKSSDENNISESIDRVFPDTFLAKLPEFKKASMTSDESSESNEVSVNAKFITEPFDVTGTLADVVSNVTMTPDDMIELTKLAEVGGGKTGEHIQETDSTMWVHDAGNIPFDSTYGIIIRVFVNRTGYLSDMSVEFFKDPLNRVSPSIVRVAR